jgi:hypothetical protein
MKNGKQKIAFFVSPAPVCANNGAHKKKTDGQSGDNISTARHVHKTQPGPTSPGLSNAVQPPDSNMSDDSEDEIIAAAVAQITNIAIAFHLTITPDLHAPYGFIKGSFDIDDYLQHFPGNFTHDFRFDAVSFTRLPDLFGLPSALKLDNDKRVDSRLALAVFLRFMAHSESQNALSFFFGIDRTEISRIYRKVLSRLSDFPSCSSALSHEIVLTLTGSQLDRHSFRLSNAYGSPFHPPSHHAPVHSSSRFPRRPVPYIRPSPSPHLRIH